MVSARERLRLWQRRHRAVFNLSFQYVDFLDVFSGEASIVSQLGDSPRGITGPTFPGFPHGAVRGVACRDVTAGSQEAMKIGETSWGLDTMSVIPLYS